MELKENADIRRALDRLQQMVEVLNDRYRDVRRERKALRDRIEELTREREVVDASTSAQLESAGNDRRRAAELEERAARAERAEAELRDTIAELRSQLAERDARLDDLGPAREELAAQRGILAREQHERAALEEKHLSAIAKLDAATRAEAMARTATVAVEEKLAAVELEREGLEARLFKAVEERDQAVAASEALREQIGSGDSTDDERLKAQQGRIEELMGELAATRKAVAAKEREVADAVKEATELRARVEQLGEETARLKAGDGVGLSAEERRKIAQQIDTAIELIDHHLSGGE